MRKRKKEKGGGKSELAKKAGEKKGRRPEKGGNLAFKFNNKKFSKWKMVLKKMKHRYIYAPNLEGFEDIWKFKSSEGRIRPSFFLKKKLMLYN